MKIEDLVKIYGIASMGGGPFPQYDGDDCRAGIRAVVLAIRDEIKGQYGWGPDLLDCELKFNEILGSSEVNSGDGND